MGYPVFSQGVTLRHTHGYYYSTCLNDYPVQIGVEPMQIMVAPGDIVVGDNDGVVVVPGDRAAEILKLAQRRHAVDVEMGKLLKAGKGHGDKEIDDLIAEVRDLEGVEQAEGYKW
jgi:4-hydroxy-4-methyl-2-oxoglutarate aldolase